MSHAENNCINTSENEEQQSGSSIPLIPNPLKKTKDTNLTVAAQSDLAQIGEPIEQIILNTYPKQPNNRSFQASWFGFKNWKNAMDAKTHIKAMKMWVGKKRRDESGTSVSTMINNNMLERHR
ncbi:unnamed protein product [Psylliodes chrysocephalus]|uniref:Uncharacterized protein n=1 Tax=Psylliodes chrysocephalus TaxID=3402493 RepID=A0A9P0CZ52_9CUCU|nr:unnamed protein product [Psylliodes chrysocephala]